MAATQVARNNSFSGFDEFVNMPGSPKLSPCTRAAATPAPAIAASSANTTATSAFNMRKIGLDENQPPPPPGSSPEALFRYYLAVELRKAGTQPDEALLDRYVKNHFDSLFKNKPQTQSQGKLQTQVASSSSHSTVATVAAVPRPTTMPSRTAVTPSLVAVGPPVSTAAASSQVATSEKDAGSPPELDTADSPALSGRSFSPVATPPALNSIGEEDQVDFVKVFDDPASTILGETSSAVKFEADDQTLSYFRTTPFRMADFESATIDPHFVENVSGAEAFSMQSATVQPPVLTTPAAAAPSSHPVDESTPMSEDGYSDDDDEQDSKQALFRQLRDGSTPESTAADMRASVSSSGSPSKSGSGTKPLNTIPMAVGTTNYLKPDPEEYKKLSSKEKRQLRNKISARNFRTRRKEYITHLEEQLADRDSIIEGLRQQLSQMTTENKSLKEEVRIIKSRTISSQDVGKILEALQSMAPINTTLTGPAASTASGRSSPNHLSAVGGSLSNDYNNGPATPSAFVNFGGESSRPSTPTLAAPSSPRPLSPRPAMFRRASPSMLPQANTKKDVAPQSSFWGGVGNGTNSNSFMPVC